ncbi:Abi family protein [Arthrobacter echini]|uniref:Abi family protein n=1 Tax=Arthrobacter echini TaxID=1529066 RepID=A0A4S5DZX7_9MICC|nr:Abi family protein [Arthrobacter echini]THJ64583.1 Abi family protein [Arthrobacter echini]
MTDYNRPYLNFEQQVHLMESRGLDCSGCDAPAALSRIGYYRLSAYTYIFRELLAPPETSETPVQYRSANFVPGYKLTDALDLYKFDNGLRMLCVEALTSLEIGLRVQVAYVLGKRDRFGHTNRSALAPDMCARPARDGNGDMFEYWMRRYADLKRQAQAEDFVRHYTLKYSGNLPIWVAVEVMDFGAITRLFGLMNRNDQNTIARKWGVKDGRRLHSWLLALGNMRNLCAHHSRLWNKHLTYDVGKVMSALVDPELHHIEDHSNAKKLYVPLSLLAYLVVRIDPTTNWPRALRTKVKQKFPSIPNVSVQTAMGFPEGWDDEHLWDYRPTQ